MADIKGRTIATTYGKLLYTSTDDGLVGNTGSTTSVITTDDMDGTSTASCLNLGIDRVGIGTNIPNELLEVSNGTHAISLSIDDTDYPAIKSGAHGAGTDNEHLRVEAVGANGRLYLRTNGNNRLTIKEDGNVGIGTDAPKSLLDVTSSTGSPVLSMVAYDADDNCQINFWNTEDVDEGSQGGITYDHHAEAIYEKLAFRAGNNSTQMYILGSGNVGIGVPDPDATLEIAGTAYASIGAATNTVWGYNAGLNLADNSSDSSNNTYIGYQAGDASHSNADQNTAVGAEALTALTSGAYNTCMGYNAGAGLTTSNNNTVVGRHALAGAAGSGNTAIGFNSLIAAAVDGSGADENTAVGFESGDTVTTGSQNTFMGHRAGDACTTGSNNVLIGHGTDCAATYDNQIALGHTVVCDTAETIRIGDAAEYLFHDFSPGGGQHIITASDVRTKKDITDVDIGLEFINALRPVNYTPKNKHDYPGELFQGGVNTVKEETERQADPTVRKEGFIAQEVKQVMDDLGVTFTGWHQNDSSRQMLGYAAFVVPLTKAVQELSAKVTALENA